jgi:metal-responsive CopG/Arc/MetJ family transcriptional regulator
MPSENGGFARYSVSINKALMQRVDELASKQNRNRSNMIETLLLCALDGDGRDIHPRIRELSVSFLVGAVTGEEAMKEIAPLVLRPATDRQQMQLFDVPTVAG